MAFESYIRAKDLDAEYQANLEDSRSDRASAWDAYSAEFASVKTAGAVISKHNLSDIDPRRNSALSNLKLRLSGKLMIASIVVFAISAIAEGGLTNQAMFSMVSILIIALIVAMMAKR